MKQVEILEYAVKGAWAKYSECLTEWEKEQENENYKRATDKAAAAHEELHKMWLELVKAEITEGEKLVEEAERATAYLGYAELINEIEKMERFLAVEEDEEERAYYNARLEELTIEAWARGIEI